MVLGGYLDPTRNITTINDRFIFGNKLINNGNLARDSDMCLAWTFWIDISIFIHDQYVYTLNHRVTITYYNVYFPFQTC